MHIEAVYVSHLLGVVVRVFGRAVLTEADNLPIGSGGQYPATSGSLRADNLAPIADSVRCEPLAVPGLVRAIPIRRFPGGEVQVS
jgi:hypothetical protein